MRIAATIVALSFAVRAETRALPYQPVRDLTMTGAAGAAWLLSQIFERQLAPSACRWCDPPGFDSSFRDALKWRDTGAAHGASNVLAYGGMPLAALGVDLFVSGRDFEAVGIDALIALQSAFLAGLFDQGVKFLVGRERPFVHALDPSQKPLTDKPADNNVSFYSGHTSFTTAIAVSAGVCASLRGDKDAWAVWATGLTLALGTGYLRIAADKHYASDVLVGALFGGLFGAGVPLLFHRPDKQPGASLSVGPQAFSVTGRF